MTPSLSGAIVPAMEPIVISTIDLDKTDEDVLVHSWCAEQLRALGLSQVLADTFADLVDWHEVDTLVGQGCEPHLVLEIAL